MRVGFVGLGKLGLPCALAVDLKGHDVIGYDTDPRVMQKETVRYREQGPNGEPSIEPILRGSRLRFAGDLDELVAEAELIFVAIQTPHEPRFEGVTRLPDDRKDFDYRWLIDGMAQVSRAVGRLARDRIVIIISTVLPGTMRRYIAPLLNKHVKLCYNPFFIAMGTTMYDFLNPELILLGAQHPSTAEDVAAFYRTINEAPVVRTTIENAEAIKVSYNTFITMKIVFANTLMELCHKIPGADVDSVTDALKLATQRIISGRYLTGGMGDGGGCHPRDNIALSWLARERGLRYDLFENLMLARERQTDWLADLMEQYDKVGDGGRLKVILGKSFKPESNITAGSPAILLRNILQERGHEVRMWDPFVDAGEPCPEFPPSVFIIGTKHPQFRSFAFPTGSVVIDPWRYLSPAPGVTLVSVGEAEHGGPDVGS